MEIELGKRHPGEPVRMRRLIRAFGEIGMPDLTGKFRIDRGIFGEEGHRDREPEPPGGRLLDLRIDDLRQRVETLDRIEVGLRHQITYRLDPLL